MGHIFYSEAADTILVYSKQDSPNHLGNEPEFIERIFYKTIEYCPSRFIFGIALVFLHTVK